MAKNLRKGSKVWLKFHNRDIEGVVKEKFTARKGSISVSKDSQRTLVYVKASGETFVKRPSELRRRK